MPTVSHATLKAALLAKQGQLASHDQVWRIKFGASAVQALWKGAEAQSLGACRSIGIHLCHFCTLCSYSTLAVGEPLPRALLCMLSPEPSRPSGKVASWLALASAVRLSARLLAQLLPHCQALSDLGSQPSLHALTFLTRGPPDFSQLWKSVLFSTHLHCSSPAVLSTATM